MRGIGIPPFLGGSLQNNRMQRYIFDCRQDQTQPPKFLNRNQKLSNLPNLPLQASQLRKESLNFDYSYYRKVPKTASLHLLNRARDLNYLMEHCNSPKDRLDDDSKEIDLLDNPKWKLDKENKLLNETKFRETKLRETTKFRKRKIMLPRESMPAVGDYHYETSSVQKKIVYDVKIRGRNTDQSKQPPIPIPEATKRVCVTLHRVNKCERSNHKVSKENRSFHKRDQSEEEYMRFIASIETSHVWMKLMNKYKLKGSKFDPSS